MIGLASVGPVEVAVGARHVEILAEEALPEARRGPEARDERPVGEVERLEAPGERRGKPVLAREAGLLERRAEAGRGAREVGEDGPGAAGRLDERRGELRPAEEVDDAHHPRLRVRDGLDPPGGEPIAGAQELVSKARVPLVAPAQELLVAAGPDEAA